LRSSEAIHCGADGDRVNEREASTKEAL